MCGGRRGGILGSVMGALFGTPKPPKIEMPKNEGVATDNMSSGETGALVELGAAEDRNKRVSAGGGSGSRARSALSGLGGGSGLGL